MYMQLIRILSKSVSVGLMDLSSYSMYRAGKFWFFNLLLSLLAP